MERVIGATVTVYDWHAGPHAPPIAETITDQAGRFRFEDLPAGRYRVVARHATMGTVTTGAELTPQYGRRVWPCLRR